MPTGSTNFPGALDAFPTTRANTDPVGPDAVNHAAALNAVQARVIKEAPLNVQWPEYAAVGNGSADDTTEVQAALTAAGVNGGEVYLPPGTYLITSALTIGSNVTLRGAGLASQIKVGGVAHAAGSIDGIRSTSTSRVTLQDFRIVGPEDGTMTTANGTDTGKGIKFDTVTDYTIRNVHISRMNIQGIYVGVGVRGKIYGNTVQEIYSGNGISLDGLSIDNVISGNTLKDIADDGIGAHNGSARTIISDNTVTNTNFGRGVDVFGAPDTLVEGNTLREIGGSGSAGRGIQIYIGLGATKPHRTIVKGNSIVGCAQSGILVDGGSDGIDDIEISGNQILTSGDKGIYIAQKVARVLIEGNQINSNTGQGIYLEHSGANIPTKVFIDGNEITANTTYGIHATASVTDVQLGDNFLTGNTTQACNMNIPTVASAASVLLPAHSGFVNVSGTTNITSMVVGAAGERVTLQFTGALTFTDGSNLKLAGNFVTTADDTITLVCDGGANWYEICRSVN